MRLTLGDLNAHHIEHPVQFDARTGVLTEVRHERTGVTTVSIRRPDAEQHLLGPSTTWPSTTPIEVSDIPGVPDSVPDTWGSS